MRDGTIVWACFLAAVASFGCGGSGDGKAVPGATASAVPADSAPEPSGITEAQAKKEFVARCSACHGKTGKGDGPGAAALNPKPRDYTDKAWQKSVTDEDIKKTMIYGGAAVGKSASMPAAPDLDGKPEMVAALVKVVRSFEK